MPWRNLLWRPGSELCRARRRHRAGQTPGRRSRPVSYKHDGHDPQGRHIYRERPLVSQRSLKDFAQHLPVEVISRLVGLPEDGRQRMREWAAATFDALGPMNGRREAAIPAVMEMLDYARGIEPLFLRPDGWAMRLVQAATRDARDHVSFGHGVHRCAGAYLAELEMQSLLRAMVTRVRQIKVGEPEVALNNVLRGYRTFPASLSFH